MKWLWIIITVATGSIGDLLAAHGMAQHHPVERFDGNGIARILRYCLTHKSVVAGLVSNAVSFISFMGLLSMTELSYAVPITALGYIARTVLARIFLGEDVNVMRWAGVLVVVAGIVLISV
jgi:drug/metabolite transporter (DMT)-like permease